MCTVEVNSLELFDIHHIKPTNDFSLDAGTVLNACNNIAGPPYAICLLPPKSRLQTGCSALLNTLSQDILNGKYITLESLPVVWNTLPQESTDSWVTVATNQDANVVTYLGSFGRVYDNLQPLPLFLDMSMSSDQKVLWGVWNGYLYSSNAFTGFVERVDSVSSPVSATSVIQYCSINSAGTFGSIVFLDKHFVKTQDGFQDVTVEGLRYTYMKFLEPANSIAPMLVVAGIDVNGIVFVYVYNTEPVFSQRKVMQIPSFSNVYSFCAVTTDLAHVLVGFASGGGLTSINVWSADTDPNSSILPEIKWTISANQTNIHAFQDMVCRTDTVNGQHYLYGYKRIDHELYFMLLRNATSNGFAFLGNGVSGQVIENTFGTWLSYITNNVANQIELIAIPGIPNNNGSYAVQPLTNNGTPLQINAITTKLFWNPTGTKLWMYEFQTNDLRSNTTSQLECSPNFYSQPQLYLNIEARIKDGGLIKYFNNPLSIPSMHWFFGTHITNQDELITPMSIFVSPHQYYRLVFSFVAASDTSFAHVDTNLQRANIRGFLLVGYTVLLHDNSNVQIFDTNGEVVFERRTTDQFPQDGEENSFATRIITAPFSLGTMPLCSPNGLYILFQKESVFTVAFNVYNTASFASFCAQSPETLSRAIARQRDFCFANLRDPLSETHNASLYFADARCSCIGGEKFASVVFEFDTSNVVSETQARLADNLPCLLNSCQDALTLPEETNVYNVTKAYCQNAKLVSCSVLFTGDPDLLSVKQGVIDQMCGGVLASCTSDQDCGAGFSCVGFSCMKKCIDDSDCPQGATCSLGKCIMPAVNTHAVEKELSASKIAAIILGVITGVMLVVFLIVFFVLFRKSKRNI